MTSELIKEIVRAKEKWLAGLVANLCPPIITTWAYSGDDTKKRWVAEYFRRNGFEIREYCGNSELWRKGRFISRFKPPALRLN